MEKEMQVQPDKADLSQEEINAIFMLVVDRLATSFVPEPARNVYCSLLKKIATASKDDKLICLADEVKNKLG